MEVLQECGETNSMTILLLEEEENYNCFTSSIIIGIQGFFN